MTYKKSWGALQRFRPYSIYLFPDLSGEDADISCADAWNRSDGESEGYSLLVVRTPRGREALHAALREGYLTAVRVDAARLLQAQRPLVGKRGIGWGRTFAFRLLGLPAPKLSGFAAAWWKLPIAEKIKSILGTWRRILQRGYYHPLRVQADACVPRKSAHWLGHGHVSNDRVDAR